MILLCSLTDPAFYEASVHSSHLLLQRRSQRARRHHFHQRSEDLIGERCQRRHQEGQQAEHSCAKGKRGPDPDGCSGRDWPLTPPAGPRVMSDLLLRGGASTDTPSSCGRGLVTPNTSRNILDLPWKKKTVQCSKSSAALPPLVFNALIDAVLFGYFFPLLFVMFLFNYWLFLSPDADRCLSKSLLYNCLYQNVFLKYCRIFGCIMWCTPRGH